MANEELEQGVCQHVTCAVPACGQPVRPHLHCCLECGKMESLLACLEYAGVTVTPWSGWSPLRRRLAPSRRTY